ncbi:hypothetical protein ACHWQZ_G015973 [Mnemiopsis leidyi]
MESVNLLSMPVTTLNADTPIDELIIDTGRKVATAENTSEGRLSGKKLKFKEKIKIEEDLKSEILHILKGSLAEKEHGASEKFLEGHLFRLAKVEDKDKDALTIESLRCLFWSLKTDIIIPKESTIINCLKIVDRMPKMNALHFVVKILSEIASFQSSHLSTVPCRKKEDYWTARRILADNNGPTRIARALKNVATSIEGSTEQFEFIVKQLHPWFISLQEKLVNSVPKEHVSELATYFTAVLLDQKTEHPNAGRYIRNILTILLNFQTDADQQKYITDLVRSLDGALEVTSLKIQQTLLILEKLAVRGRCGKIRRSDNGAILDHLIRICLEAKESETDREVVKITLNLFIFLYESPDFLSQHAVVKENLEFIKFLVRASMSEVHRNACHKIITFLFLNDPKNSAWRESIPREDENMPKVLISLLMKVEEDEQANLREKKDKSGSGEQRKERRKAISRHSCHEGKNKYMSLIMLAWFIFSYLRDTAMDLFLALEKLVENIENPLAWLLLIFATLPLFICNYVSLRNFYSASPLSIYVSLEGHVPRLKLFKYVFPWRFDSVRHTLFNILTLLQLHPVITTIDILCHHVQQRGNILASQYQIKKLGCLEAMLENIPCLLIKIIQLAAQIERGQFKWSSAMNIFEIVSIFNSVFSLSKSFLDLEICGRLVDRGRFQIRNLSQKATLFFGFFTMITSRILMFLILEARFEKQFFLFVIFLHIFITFVIHLLTHGARAGKDGNYEDEHFVFIRRFDWRLLPFTLSEGFLVLLRNPVEFLGVYSNYNYVRKWWQFFSIYSLHLTEVLVINLWFVISTSLSKLLGDKIMFAMSILSMGLFLSSGFIFVIYFFAVHPDKKETFKFVAENKYQESRHVKPEHDYDWKDRMCLREEENFNINGTKLAYRDSKEIEISCEQDSEIEENYTEQTSKFKIYDRSFKIERQGSKESEHSL